MTVQRIIAEKYAMSLPIRIAGFALFIKKTLEKLWLDIEGQRFWTVNI
jgi:hypothetical protein